MLKNEKIKKEKGITLIALVITIIIILILATVAIKLAFGDNGLIKEAEKSKDMMNNSIKEEEEGSNSVMQEIANILQNDDEKPNTEAKSYVGYYADVDGNGTVDGIIYADLAVGGSGQWKDKDGAFTIPKITSGLKQYKVSKKNYNDDFGTADIIAPVEGTSGTERFYVMSLDDLYNEKYRFCYNSLNYIHEMKWGITMPDFGKGKDNTNNLVNCQDYLGHCSGTCGLYCWFGYQRDLYNEFKNWFIPSRGEWAVFAHNLNISRLNYGDKQLSHSYWTSTQYESTGAWRAYLFHGSLDYGDASECEAYVRLSTTF